MPRTTHDILQKVGDDMTGTIYRGGTAIKNTVLVNPQIVYAMDGSGSITFDCPDEIQMYDYIYTDGNYFLVTERTNNTWRALWIPQLLNHIIVTDGYGFEFPFTDTYLSDILTFLNGILDRPYNKLFQKFTITTDVPNTKISTTFSKDTITTALQQIADILNCFVVYDNFNIKLTASLEQNTAILMRGKNCVVTREHENGLIPTRVFTLGASDYVPSEYPYNTLTKSMLSTTYDDATGVITGYKANIDSFTSYREGTEKRRGVSYFIYAGWITGQNYYGVQVLSTTDQFISSGFDTGDYRLSTYKYNGTKKINRVKVLSSRHIMDLFFEYQVERYDEDGNDISALNDGSIVVVENHNDLYKPSAYEQNKKVSIQKFFDTPITLSEWRYTKDKFISLTDGGTYYVLRLSYAGSTNTFGGGIHYGVLGTSKLDVETIFRVKATSSEQWVDLKFSKTIGGETLSLTFADLQELRIYGTYNESNYLQTSNLMDALALQSMQRPLKEYDLVLTGNSNFKAGQMATFEGGQYLVQQVQKTVDKTTIKLSTKPYDVYLRQFLNIYDTQRNMQREYRRR